MAGGEVLGVVLLDEVHLSILSGHQVRPGGQGGGGDPFNSQPGQNMICDGRGKKM